jgi:hypothetical protein
VEPLPPTESANEAAASSTGDRQGSQAPESARQAQAGTKFDLSQAEVHARGQKSAPVQPPKAKKGDSNVLYIEGSASIVPFAALEAFWRALWSILAAALGTHRTEVLYTPAAQLQEGQLMASAHYWMSPELVDLLASPSGWARLQLGLRMLCDPYLWQTDKLCARYPEQPWQELLETVRAARDEILGPKLPCQVEVEFSRIGQVAKLGPELAPCRPVLETVRTEYLTGRSVGFKLDEVHLMHFSTKSGHASVDVEFKPGKESIKEVRDVSREHAPIIKVEVEVLRHDDVVVTRTLKSTTVICESLFQED